MDQWHDVLLSHTSVHCAKSGRATYRTWHCSVGPSDDMAGCGWPFRIQHKGRVVVPDWIT